MMSRGARVGPFARLDGQQRAAIEHDGDAPLAVIAGAGSGKSSTLACRVARLAAAWAADAVLERRENGVPLRQRHHLALIAPQRFCVAQQGTFRDRAYVSLTRFIPPEVAVPFDALAPRTPLPATPAAAQTTGEAIDIAARLSARWA